MRMLIYIIVTLVGLLIALFGILGILGSRLPPTHTASITFEVGSPRDTVWAALDDVASFPSWFPGIDKIEMLPDRDGRRAFRQKQGWNWFVMEETAKNPPSLVTRTITDEQGPFSGSWEHKLDELPSNRTRLTVTETGTIKSPIPRAIMKYAFGYDYYLNKFARAVQTKLGS